MFGLGLDMSAISNIVCGGGWKGTRSERVKVKAWILLLAAIALGGISLATNQPVWTFAAGTLAALTLTASAVLFVRERPRVFKFPWGHAGHDLRKLYGASGGGVAPKPRATNTEPRHSADGSQPFGSATTREPPAAGSHR